MMMQMRMKIMVWDNMGWDASYEPDPDGSIASERKHRRPWQGCSDGFCGAEDCDRCFPGSDLYDLNND